MEEEKFAIRVEWFDDISSLVRSYTLFYFPTDRSVEMVCIIYNLVFLVNCVDYMLSYAQILE